MENLFPVLLEGLERLSKEVELYIKDPQDIDIEVILKKILNKYYLDKKKI